VSPRVSLVPWQRIVALAIAVGMGLAVSRPPVQADDAPSVVGRVALQATGPQAVAEHGSGRASPGSGASRAENKTDSGQTPGTAASEQREDAAHDPYDLSHANASAKLNDLSEWRYDLAICTLIVFFLLLIVLRAVAWGPIMSGLQNREKSITSQIEEAERNAKESAAQLEAYRAKLAEAARKAQEIIAQARRDAEAAAEKIREEAKRDALSQRQRALANIEAAKNAALRDIAEKSTDMAVSLAGRIVRRELNPHDHARLISEAMASLPSEN